MTLKDFQKVILGNSEIVLFQVPTGPLIIIFLTSVYLRLVPKIILAFFLKSLGRCCVFSFGLLRINCVVADSFALKTKAFWIAVFSDNSFRIFRGKLVSVFTEFSFVARTNFFFFTRTLWQT